MTKNPVEKKENVYLFYGEDDFSLQRKIQRWKSEFAKKYSGSSIVLIDGQSESSLASRFEEILSPSLFSSKKLILAKNCLPTKSGQTELTDLVLRTIERLPADYFLVFWQAGKPDQRLVSTKQILKSGIKVEEFKLPHGKALNNWLKTEAKNLGVSIDDEAMEVLAQFLGRDLYEEKKAGGKVIEVKEQFDLWQAFSELSKLGSLGGRITKSEVESLIMPKSPENIFRLSDSIVNGNKKEAFSEFENFVASSQADEKAAIIKIVALLSEQLRSLLAVTYLTRLSLNQDEIADKLGWSPGRVFINLKLAKELSADRIERLLRRLLEIDKTIKRSDLSPNLLMGLFIREASGQ
jgi:DNA polymerase-3 subunit delta